MVIFTERNDADRFHEAMKKVEEGNRMAEMGRREIEELSEKMRIQYGERGTSADRDGDGRYNERRYDDKGSGYGERYNEHYGERYNEHYDERRDSMGRYR